MRYPHPSSRPASAGELAADRVVHIVGLACGGMAAAILLALAAERFGPVAFATAATYAMGLLAMLSFSAAYNLSTGSRRREMLCRLDHAAIFVMIAGTYTPFTVLGLSGGWSLGMTLAVWGIAAAGVAIKLSVPTSRFAGLSTGLYLAFGWLGMIAIGPFIASIQAAILGLVGTGGVLYSVGAIFHMWQKLPYQKAIWHGFVLVAAAVHYAAVCGLVLGSS